MNKLPLKPGKLLEGNINIATVIKVKPYTPKELSNLYEVPPRTLNKWLIPFQQQIGERIGQWYNVIQVELIFSKLGVPYSIHETD